jgi:hypothetical protein
MSDSAPTILFEHRCRRCVDPAAGYRTWRIARALRHLKLHVGTAGLDITTNRWSSNNERELKG